MTRDILFALYEKYQPFVTYEVGPDGLIEVFSENTPKEAKEAFYEAEKILKNPNYEPIL